MAHTTGLLSILSVFTSFLKVQQRTIPHFEAHSAYDAKPIFVQTNEHSVDDVLIPPWKCLHARKFHGYHFRLDGPERPGQIKKKNLKTVHFDMDSNI